MKSEPLLAFDFDGTLAPIVERPEDARASADIVQRLQRLAARRPLAIVTGRAIADVVARLGFEPSYLIGNHGAEDSARGVDVPVSAAMAALRARLERGASGLQASGVRIEDKGRSLALHYRLAADPAAAAVVIERALLPLDPALKTFGGKCVVNVVDADSPDKGDAVAALVARSGAATAFFIGDDVNDESVFTRAEPHWLTVRVGRDDPDSRAMYFLDSQAEVATLLDRMLEAAAR